MSKITENDLQEALRGFFLNDADGDFAMALEEALGDEPPSLDGCETFQEAGLLTRDHGLVLRIGGAEFQITIKRSR